MAKRVSNPRQFSGFGAMEVEDHAGNETPKPDISRGRTFQDRSSFSPVGPVPDWSSGSIGYDARLRASRLEPDLHASQTTSFRISDTPYNTAVVDVTKAPLLRSPSRFGNHGELEGMRYLRGSIDFDDLEEFDYLDDYLGDFRMSRSAANSMMDLTTFLDTNPPPLAKSTHASESSVESPDRTSVTKLPWWKFRSPGTPSNAHRQSDTPSSANTAFKKTPASSFEISPTKVSVDTPPTPISPSYRPVSNELLPQDKKPPPKFALRSTKSSKTLRPKTPTILHLSHELSKIDKGDVGVRASRPEVEAQLMGLGIRSAEADLIYQGTGRDPQRYDDSPILGWAVPSAPDTALSTPTHQRVIPSVSTAPDTALSTLAHQRFNPTVPTSPDSFSRYGGSSESKAVNCNGADQSATHRAPPKLLISTADDVGPAYGETDIVKPLRQVLSSPSAEKFRNRRRITADLQVPTTSSPNAFGKLKQSAKAWASNLADRPGSPTLPQDNPGNGYPSVHTGFQNSLPIEVVELRRKLGLEPVAFAHPQERQHPNHLLAWDTKNVWCTQCMLGPESSNDIDELEAKKREQGVKTHNVPSDMQRVAPTKCKLCDAPCCAWSKNRYYLQSTQKNQIPHQDAPGPMDPTWRSRCDPKAFEIIVKSRANLIRARMDAHSAVADIEKTCKFGQDPSTFVRCTDCAELVCPSCAGRCPMEECGLIRCRSCVADPWDECFLHDGDDVATVTPESVSRSAHRRAERNLKKKMETLGVSSLPTPPKGCRWELPS